MTVTNILYSSAGRPEVQHASLAEGVCAICGNTEGPFLPAKKAFRSGFSDYSALAAPESEIVCSACSWVMSGIPPATLRFWCTFHRTDVPLPRSLEVTDGLGLDETVFLTNRSNLLPLTEALLNPPSGVWFMTLAVSGQKHIIPFAKLNNGAGAWTIRFEAVDLNSDPATFADVLFHVASLRAAQFGADEIAKLQPNVNRLKGDNIAIWKEHATALSTHRDSLLVELANFLTTKEVINDNIEIAQRSRVK